MGAIQIIPLLEAGLETGAGHVAQPNHTRLSAVERWHADDHYRIREGRRKRDVLPEVVDCRFRPVRAFGHDAKNDALGVVEVRDIELAVFVLAEGAEAVGRVEDLLGGPTAIVLLSGGPDAPGTEVGVEV